MFILMGSSVGGFLQPHVVTAFCACQLSWALVRFTPLAGLIPGRPEAMGLFIICLTVGATCIFLR